jgi:hypothetical protein
MSDFFVSSTAADRLWAEWIAWQLEEAGSIDSGFVGIASPTQLAAIRLQTQASGSFQLSQLYFYASSLHRHVFS